MNNKNINILFLTKWYPNEDDPQLGVFVQKHAKAVALFCNVQVVFALAHSNLKLKFQIVNSSENGFPEYIVYYKKSSSFFKPIVNFLRYYMAMKLGIKQAKKNVKKIDLIHIHILNRPALFYFSNFNIPFIITEHWTGYVSGTFKKSGIIKRRFTKFIISRAKAITVVSKNLRNNMLDLGLSNKYFIVPNIVESINPPDYTDNDKIKILTVADLNDEHKNISGIIKAINEVVKQRPDIELHIIGDGPQRAMLEHLSDSLLLNNKIVFFHGRKNNEYVYQFFKHIDFVIINSNYETFSVVAAEALANGKPVITTICGGPEEFVTSEFGILIEKNNQPQLEKAILKMIVSFKNYSPQKLNKYICDKLSYEKIGNEFFEIYKTVLKK